MQNQSSFHTSKNQTSFHIQSQIKDPMVNTFSPNKLRIFLFDFYLNLYETKGFIASF